MTTAFVLSGGGSLGAVQVGMLLALADRQVVPDLFVGTSVGALNAAFLAGRPGPRGIDELAGIWSRLRRQDIFPTTPARLLRAATGRESGFADPAPLRRLVAEHLSYDRLEDAPWPVTVVATEVTTGQEVQLASGPAVDAVLASAALPAVFPPVAIDDHVLMDGGVVNNTPISAAMSLGADVIYVLPTGYACALTAAPRSPVGMAMHAVTVAIQQRLIADVQSCQGQVTLRVAPTLCPLAVSPVDFRHTRELIRRARRATQGWLDAPFADDQSRHLRLHSHAHPALARQAAP
ncbi:MAG TPA: patatin-like phospholipase family protein [Mycobacteriales bacterium]|nr:patatin-like phospholipase family protein [Mycobacteriales bacterium]